MLEQSVELLSVVNFRSPVDLINHVLGVLANLVLQAIEIVLHVHIDVLVAVLCSILDVHIASIVWPASSLKRHAVAQMRAAVSRAS